MKKRLVSLCLMAVLLLSLSTTAYAESIETEDKGWLVRFTGQNPMPSNFTMKDFEDVLKGMQPGDDCVLTVRVRNDYATTTDWYLENKVIQSLEDSVKNAHGGGYSYVLTYDGPGGEKEFFNSTTVGGNATEGGEGLNQAAAGMANYRYMDTLAQGDSGVVTLKVKLDGQTQGNSYQDTLAELSMRFATMLRDDDTRSTPNPRQIVRTGDESDLYLYIGVFGVSGVFVLLLAIYALTANKRKKKGEEKK